MPVIEDRLAALGLTLPAVPAAPPGVEFNFELVRVAGDIAYVSGHGPIDGSAPTVVGKVGAEVSVERAYDAARAVAVRSGRPDSNRGPPAPKAGALPGCATPRHPKE